MPKKVFTISVTDNTDKIMEELKKEFSRPSKAEVIRLAVALLKVASEARNRGCKLALVDADGGNPETILLPA